MADLPEEAVAKAYTSGTGLREALEVGGAGVATSALGGDRTRWASGALFAHDDGIELQLLANGPQSGVKSYEATLTDAIPAGAVLALSFRNLGGAVNQLKNATVPIAAQVEQVLGVSLEQLEQALTGEGILYVRPGTPIPEVTIVAKPKDLSQTALTLDRVVRHLAPAGSTPTSVTIDGVPVQKLDLGAVGIVYGAVGGRFVLSDSANAIRAVRDGGGDKLADDKTFQAARDAASMPDTTAGWLYVNVKDAVPMIEGIAQLSSQQLPANVAENLHPLRSLLVYAAGKGDDTKVTAFVQTN
jgi:hypothetical protein